MYIAKMSSGIVLVRLVVFRNQALYSFLQHCPWQLDPFGYVRWPVVRCGRPV